VFFVELISLWLVERRTVSFPFPSPKHCVTALFSTVLLFVRVAVKDFMCPDKPFELWFRNLVLICFDHATYTLLRDCSQLSQHTAHTAERVDRQGQNHSGFERDTQIGGGVEWQLYIYVWYTYVYIYTQYIYIWSIYKYIFIYMHMLYYMWWCVILLYIYYYTR
jgi:hypothetical protein